MINEEKLLSELKEIFNLYSVDNALNTPDFLLAEYVVNVLKAYGQTHSTTVEWHKHDDDEDTGEPTTDADATIEEFIKNVDIGEPPVTDVQALRDSDGNEMPEKAPEKGYEWVLQHEACDQGHYGHSWWAQVQNLTEPKYALILGSAKLFASKWIIYERTKGPFAGAVKALDAGNNVLEKIARRVLNEMNESV